MHAEPERPPELIPLLRNVEPRSAPGISLGESAPSFVGLPGVDGREYSLASFAQHRVLVLAFLGNACPAAKGCLPELVDLQSRLASLGVQVVGINSNNPHLSPTDRFEEMVRFSTERRLGFPYLKDPDGAFARLCGARNTPHFLVLDEGRRLRYRGRMFDSREPARATRRDLEDAIVAVVDGRPFEGTETPALGCSIVW